MGSFPESLIDLKFGSVSCLPLLSVAAIHGTVHYARPLLCPPVKQIP